MVVYTEAKSQRGGLNLPGKKELDACSWESLTRRYNSQVGSLLNSFICSLSSSQAPDEQKDRRVNTQLLSTTRGYLERQMCEFCGLSSYCNSYRILRTVGTTLLKTSPQGFRLKASRCVENSSIRTNRS